MTEQWTNSKGVKFVGQTASVPASDFKTAQVVDYNDYNNLIVSVAQNDPDPSEALNSGTQSVAFEAVMKDGSGNTVNGWEYNFDCLSIGEIPLVFSSITQIFGGISGVVVFPASVIEGQVGSFKIISGPFKAAASITVAA